MKRSKPRTGIDTEKLDRTVAEAQRARLERYEGYREQSLRIHPWVCGRCGRTFSREILHELTVHHKDHDHDNNPPDGSNWENLCVYCHDNEHRRFIDRVKGHDPFIAERAVQPTTHKPFSGLDGLLKRKLKK